MTSGSIEQNLLEEGLISPKDLQKAEEIREENGGHLGDILIGLGALSEEQYQRQYAAFNALTYYDLKQLMSMETQEDLFLGIPYQVALNRTLLPIRRVDAGKKVEVVSLDMLSEELENQIIFQTQCEGLVVSLTHRDALVQAIRYHYGRYLRTSKYSPSQAQELSDAKQQIDLHREGFCPSCGYPRPPEAIVCSHCDYLLNKPSNDPLAGKLIDNQWKLIKRLGEGGMGLVYEGLHVPNDEPIAIKLLRAQTMLNEETVQRFYHEAQILRRLKHPNIIDVYKFGFELPFGFYLIMELLSGCDLDTFLSKYERGSILPTICRLFIVVCEAMHHAHEEGIIHRDLKPDNIFILGGPGQVDGIKVLDFGIAKDQKEPSKITKVGMTMGTPRYLSPEQAMGFPLDPRSDIYSLCILLFESLTGKSVFRADSPYQYAMRHVYSPPPKLTDVRPDIHYPSALLKLMEVGLAKQADERPSTMLEVQVYLTEALNELSENAEDDDIPFLSHNFVAPEHKPSSLKEQFSKDHENDKISPRQITQQLVAIQALPDPDEINMRPPAQESNAIDLSSHDDDPDSPFLQLPSIREDQLRKQEVVRRPANEKRMLARLQTDDPKSYQHTHFATATSRPPSSLDNHLPFAPFSHSEKHQVFQPTHRTTGSNLVFQDPSKRSRTALQTLPAPRETPGEQSLNRLQFILFGIIGLLLFLIVFAISQPKKKHTSPQRPLSSIPKTKTTTQPKNLKEIGYLNISCLPKNARVLIGSKTRVLCPTSLLLLPKGLHHLVISKKGYKSQELYVKINSKRTSSIHILLRK